MRLEKHLLVSAILASGATVAGNMPGAVAVILGGVGIDIIDHGLWGVMSIRPLTVENAKRVAWDKFKRMEPGFYFFHTFEIFILCWWLSLKWELGKYFMLGYGVHLLMDGIKYVTVKRNWRWMEAWWCWHWVWKWSKKVLYSSSG